MILVTGFEGYGGKKDNPSAAVIAELDGTSVDGVGICGKLLSVDLSSVRRSIPELISELKPKVVISFGLWPGEQVVRLERVAINCADFEISDNTGLKAKEEVIGGGSAAYFTTLPIDEIERSVRNAGIPCRRSGSAGTYLCNATMYLTLAACAKLSPATRAGFIHMPYLPSQVAELLDQVAEESIVEQHQRFDYASMDLGCMVQAARIALASALKAHSN